MMYYFIVLKFLRCLKNLSITSYAFTKYWASRLSKEEYYTFCKIYYDIIWKSVSLLINLIRTPTCSVSFYIEVMITRVFVVQIVSSSIPWPFSVLEIFCYLLILHLLVMQPMHIFTHNVNNYRNSKTCV